MQVYFWGTRGSLPASITSGAIETKIFKAIQSSRAHPLETDDAIKTFIHNELPFPVRGSYGGNTSCVELRGMEAYVLCDAGTGLRDFGNAYMKAKMSGQKNLPGTFHIFMSHPHWDHIQGFPLHPPSCRAITSTFMEAMTTSNESLSGSRMNPAFPCRFRS